MVNRKKIKEKEKKKTKVGRRKERRLLKVQTAKISRVYSLL
jgi:hypothetical protein